MQAPSILSLIIEEAQPVRSADASEQRAGVDRAKASVAMLYTGRGEPLLIKRQEIVHGEKP